jgi:hypothetical protein
MRGSPGILPAPDLPPGPRVALVVATSHYDDPALRQLRAPVHDAADFAKVLGDPGIGGFIITQMIDQPEGAIRRAIASFLSGRGVDDTLLVYLSCHGVQDARGRLFFAATDTVRDQPAATAVRAAEVWEQMEECRARRQILILDCCFSGAFSERGKGDAELEGQLAPQGRGRSVLTASRGFEYSFEGEPLGVEAPGSVFTTGLVEGLRTGAADVNRDGVISLVDAYDYAYRHVQQVGAKQTPQLWLFSGEGESLVLARSPVGRTVNPARLPESLAQGLDSRYPSLRVGAVNELAGWLTDPDPARVLAATQALRQVTDTDIPVVARAARDHLGIDVSPAATELPAGPGRTETPTPTYPVSVGTNALPTSGAKDEPGQAELPIPDHRRTLIVIFYLLPFYNLLGLFIKSRSVRVNIIQAVGIQAIFFAAGECVNSLFEHRYNHLVARVTWEPWYSILIILGTIGFILGGFLLVFCIMQILKRKQPRIYLLTDLANGIISLREPL